MQFEEFFKKKRIDLDALQKVEPALFSEFKTHFGLMGEKSFDHTKKYWFNKLRLQFPAPVEEKIEKVKIDNPLAEQTITESLIEETATKPKLGFTPKFKAPAPKPAEAGSSIEAKSEEQPASTPAAKLGFTPKFKAASPPKPAAEQAEPVKSEETPSTPKLGFTPKFKAANLPKPATEQAEPAKEEKAIASPPTPKLGFTPKFKATNLPKPAVEHSEPAKDEEQPVASTPAPKLGFTPKFKAANMPKPVEKTADEVPSTSGEETPSTPPESAEAKPAYKPRFNMKNIPKKEE